MTADRPAPALTDEDRAIIERAYDAAFNPLDRGCAAECEAVYAAGLAEGIRRERERCAKVCDGNVIIGPLPLDTYAEGQNDCARECAAAIRAGEPPDRAAPK